MTGTLALVGGGEFTDGCTFDADLLKESGATEVVVLPTAAAYENPDKQVALAAEWFASLGATVLTVPVMQRPAALEAVHADVVRQARFVYVVGSSPLHLRSVLKETPVIAALVEAWQGGAVVAGAAESASALCDPMVDPRGGAFTMGLGLMNGMAVVPMAAGDTIEHHRRTFDLAAARVVVVTIPERSALIRAADGTWRAGGEGGAPRVFLAGAEKGLDVLP